MSLKPVLARLAAGERLAGIEAEHAFGLIMAGEATPAQIAGLLMAMRVRGETVAEMTGAVRAMRARMITVDAPAEAIDIVGTGGDAAGTLNISTRCGAGGGGLQRAGGQARQSGVVLAVGGGGCPGRPGRESRGAVRSPARRAGAGRHLLPDGAAPSCGCLRTLPAPGWNLAPAPSSTCLGPLANPAQVRRQMTGAFAPEWLRPMAEALLRLGTERAWLVHGQGA